MKKVNTISIYETASKASGIAVVIAMATIFALFFADCSTARAQNAQNLGSPAFANPSEVSYRPSEKRLRAILELSSSKYTIPNVGQETVRQFRGWDPARPRPSFPQELAAGPTLRARLGDLVEISFLNTIDDENFPFTFTTEKRPKMPSFGCDVSGGPPTGDNPVYPYPGNDTFPNCFHGSNTANIHFHGTHTSPDGLSDNVLVEILPQVKQPDWTATFNRIFNSGKIPPKWEDMPRDYKEKQLEMIGEHDKEAAKRARNNNLPVPESLLDADLRMIHAGEWPQYLMGAFPNFFEIPDYASGHFKAGQAPGTHWYHAHKHGSTSQDIYNGLSGALIIESTQRCLPTDPKQPDKVVCGYDQFIRKYYGWGDRYGAHEKIFVFQQFDSTQNLERTRTNTPPVQPTRAPRAVMVNGKLTPTLTMQPGEVQLWRFINATEGNNQGVLNGVFQVQGFAFKQTAFDGVQFNPDNYKNQPFLQNQVPGGLVLAAGNRADVLVQAPATPGVYVFTNTFRTTKTNLFFVEVKCPAGSTGNCTDKSTPNPPFPTTWPEMPAFLHDLKPPGPYDVKNPNSPVKFQWENGRTGTGLLPTTTTTAFPPHFMINDKQFGENKVDQCMPLNGLQDWILENYTTVAHPFHIHINPFQIIRMEIPSLIDSSKPATDDNVKYSVYQPEKDFIWSDVIAIPIAVINSNGTKIWPGRITIRQTYLDFTGTYVLHCHILAHEDRGMMQLVRVVPAAEYPQGCEKNIPEHH